MVVERVVDARDLESPRPLETVLAAVRALCDGEYVAMLHRHRPLPLYPMLATIGCDHRTIAGDDVPFRILIWRRGDAVAAAHCGPAEAAPSHPSGGCS